MAKPRTKNQAASTQREMLTALTKAGYKLEGFSNKRETLVVRLTPVDLIEAGRHVAENVCAELGLQSRCNVFAESAQKLLILSVNMPKQTPAPSTKHQPPATQEERSD